MQTTIYLSYSLFLALHLLYISWKIVLKYWILMSVYMCLDYFSSVGSKDVY